MGMKAGLDGSCGGCSSSGADGARGEVGGGANTANVGDGAAPMTASKVRVKDGTTECWELRGAGGWRMNYHNQLELPPALEYVAGLAPTRAGGLDAKQKQTGIRDGDWRVHVDV